MAINLLVYGQEQVISAGFLRSRGGELRAGRMATKYEDTEDVGSLGGALATFKDYFVVNPNDPRTFTRNGLQLAESRRSVLQDMREFPRWATEPDTKVRTLLDMLMPNMKGNSLAMCFLPLKDVVITQESRDMVNFDVANLMYFQQRPAYSPVYVQNSLEALAYALSPFYGDTIWEVATPLGQTGEPVSTGAVIQTYTTDPAQWDKTKAILAQKQSIADAALVPKGADAIFEAMSPALLAYSQWFDFAQKGLVGKTIKVDTLPASTISLKYLAEVVMGMRPITTVESVMPLYGAGPTYVDAETLDRCFDALEVAYQHTRSLSMRRIPLSNRYLVRGGNQRQYTIAGSPEFSRVNYKRGYTLTLGGRNISVYRPEYQITGAGTKNVFAYNNPMISPSTASSAYRTTVVPSEIVMAFSEEIDLVQPTTGAAGAAATAADYVDAIRLLNEHLHDSFYLPRNWTAKAGLNQTVLGAMNALMSSKGVGDVIPINGAKIADAGEIKASMPLRDYSMKVVSAEHVRTIGNPVFLWNRPLQSRLAGYWAPFPSEQEEVGTGWYCR